MIYEKKDITAIIIKNEFDACTAEELQILEKWYASLDDEDQLKAFSESDKNLKRTKMFDSINAKINAMETERPKVIEFKIRRSIIYYIARIAAILILVSGTYLLTRLLIIKNAKNIQYVTLTNKTVKPLKIILSDKSLLWLQVNSTVKYPRTFSKNRKIIFVGGKVFFNISHSPTKPFIVETAKGISTTVLGTAFVIEKDTIYDELKVSVLRGKVQVADAHRKYALLTKNQGELINVVTKDSKSLVVDSVQLTSWFTSKVVLDNVPLSKVASTIEENFGYKVAFVPSKLGSKFCSITYNTTDDVNHILTLLDKIYHTTHNISGTLITIKAIQIRK